MLYERYTAEYKGITVNYCMDLKIYKLHNGILSFKKLLYKNQFLAASIQAKMLQNIRMLIKTRSGGLSSPEMQGMGKGNDKPQAWAVFNMEPITAWLIRSLLHGVRSQSELLHPQTQGINLPSPAPKLDFY